MRIANLQLQQGLVVRPLHQNDMAHCHDVLTLKAVLNKKSFEASLESFDQCFIVRPNGRIYVRKKCPLCQYFGTGT